MSVARDARVIIIARRPAAQHAHVDPLPPERRKRIAQTRELYARSRIASAWLA
jgi:hypothetical protein